MRRLLLSAGAILAIAVVTGVWATRPDPLPADTFAGVAGEAAAGELVFNAAGCAGCHSAPETDGDARLVLAGGQRFATEFGTFVAPNVSPSDAGIGGWSLSDFANATQRGIAPNGAHYYPVFPYSSYALAEPQDIADLWAFWQTLPPSDAASLPHDIGFPYSVRRGLGLWKARYVPDLMRTMDTTDPQIARGQYLVEALGHCAECHTPRDALGGLNRDAWMAGAPNPSGKGTIPALTPDKLEWSAGDIASYLKTGFTPDYDSAGGSMVEVIANIALLPDADRDAIAAYLKALPPAG
ncbi:c-type cytochrome [Jannaschia donghaensis]|uniref:Nicotinate dehydrogenase subunit B n=1 Tax=Jannaschia donghaensis TaxID=420998 RepID=A0A0M6YM73_9RHOB|nr:cytochrome c [Jannaschia donghaensis]CTQ50613.1 Nicotinate dehydrogenase subunit B [Jannaschia donghaensis]